MKYIILSDGERMKIDAPCFIFLNQWKWHNVEGYATRTRYTHGKGYLLTIHHHLLLPIPGLVVDHINGDALDNRIQNLRYATHTQNMQNRTKKRKSLSIYKGVSMHHGKWVTQIRIAGRLVERVCASELEAAKLYDRSARKHFKKFARINNA